MYYMKPLKIAHTYTFLTKNFYGFETVFALWFWVFLVFYMRIMQSENFATYTRVLSPVWNRPLYTRIIREKNFAPDIYENCGAFRIGWRLIERWYLCVRLYHVLYMRSSFGWGCFVDWPMSNFGCKSVMGLHKFIVKMWLCICNCMCICVCIWYWLWFCYRLDSVVIRL